MIPILCLLFLAQSAPNAYLQALVEADKHLTAAKTAESKLNLERAADSVELALKSLEDMGKPPYKNANNYKKAELRTRDFLRRIEALRKNESFDDRGALDSAFNRVNAVHETLIEGVMSKKK